MTERPEPTLETPASSPPDDGGDGGPSPHRPFLSPRLTYLLIGGAAIGVIVVMCLIVGLLIALQ